MTGVDPRAFVGPGVELGTGVTIGPFAVVTGPCRLGDEVWIGPHSSIGTPAEVRGGPHPPLAEGGGAGVLIGDRTVIREGCTVNQGTHRPTTIGPDGYVMAGAHVPHDGWLGAGCTISCAVLIGGHTWIGDGANVGLGAVLHQRSVVGAYAMVGMQATVTRPIPPFATAVGVPARVTGANRVRLTGLGLPDDEVARWSARLAAGEVAGSDGPATLAAHVEAWTAQVAAGGG